MATHPNQNEIIENFQTFASQIFKLDEKTVAEICSRFQIHILSKKTLVINRGQIYDRIHFVHSGLVRGYYYDDEKEVTNWFAKTNDFIISPRGYLTKQPSDECIETLEDSVLLSITLENLSYLYANFPEASNISRILTEHYLYRYDKKIRLLRIQNSERRVKSFIEQYPNEFQQLPHKYLSSFLGLAPETFSRIISRKN